MKQIGEILKQRRIELGFSIDEIHEKTKLSPLHIKAIEEGNIDYFKHDLSYLKFFLQYYCQAVYVDFDEIKEDYEGILNEYNETQAIKRLEVTQASNENIQRRIQNHQNLYKKPKGSIGIEFKKIDHQTIITLMIIALLALLLLFGFFKFVLPILTGQTNKEKIVEVNEPVKQTDANQPVKETPVKEVQPVAQIKSVIQDYSNYQISGIPKKDMTLKLKFNSETWIQVYINDLPVNEPTSQVYEANTEVLIPIKEDTNKVTIHFGNLLGAKVFVNDTLVTLDEIAQASTEGIKLNFHFGGQE